MSNKGRHWKLKQKRKMPPRTEDHQRKINTKMIGREHSEEHNEKVSLALSGKKKSEEHCKRMRKSKGKYSKEFCRKTSERLIGHEVSDKTRQKIRFAQICRVNNGNHHWNEVAPFGLENEPLERAFDFFFLPIFVADVRHTFKALVTWDKHSKQHQLDFVSWILRCNLEADELPHEKMKKKAWDEQRDKAFYDTKELESILRYKQLEAETNFVEVIRRVYNLCNELRERYNLQRLPILVFDERWRFYCVKMQDLIKEFRISRDFKKFDERRRELDKQFLYLLDEICKNLHTNFAELVRESLETNQSIDQDRIVSPWRPKDEV